MKWSGQLLKNIKSKFGNPVQPPLLSLVPFKGPKKSWAPQKVKILCRDHLETLNWPHLVIWQGRIHNPPRHIYSTVALIVKINFYLMFKIVP